MDEKASMSDVEKRFWSKVRIGDGCWEWTAADGPRGYGRFWLPRGFLSAFGERPTTARGKLFIASRASWFISTKKDPGSLWVLHHCDNPKCVRPGHLYLGTPRENSADMVRRKRHFSIRSPEKVVRGSRHGNAKLTPNLVRWLRTEYQRGRTMRDLARDVGLSFACTRSAVRRETWRHI